ncbi:MAG: hypothetical protein HOY69_04820 [Streptomyces sp.]|nr:hypothetical protein [Streptomyces sp.]
MRVGRRGVSRLLPRAPRLRRRPLAAALAVAAAVLAVSAAHGSAPDRRVAVRRPPVPAAGRAVQSQANQLVRAPVRIADAAAVGLLQPGDRVDVLAAARVVAAAVTVVTVPEQSAGPPAAPADAAAAEGELPRGTADPGGPGGALVVLAVPRRVAAALSGAAATTPLAVSLC